MVYLGLLGTESCRFWPHRVAEFPVLVDSDGVFTCFYCPVDWEKSKSLGVPFDQPILKDLEGCALNWNHCSRSVDRAVYEIVHCIKQREIASCIVLSSIDKQVHC